MTPWDDTWIQALSAVGKDTDLKLLSLKEHNLKKIELCVCGGGELIDNMEQWLKSVKSVSDFDQVQRKWRNFEHDFADFIWDPEGIATQS